MNPSVLENHAQTQYLQIILNNHQSLWENRLKKLEYVWSFVFIFYFLALIFILIYSILLENSKQIESPFNNDGKQCGYDIEVRDCPIQMQLIISNETSNICVKYCPDVNSYTLDCQQNQITTESQLIQVDNICIKENQFLSSFNYFHKNQIYLPIIIITCLISYIISLFQFNYLLKSYLCIRNIILILTSLSIIGLALWIRLSSQTIIQSEQFQIMIYILTFCYAFFLFYQFRYVINAYVQMHTFYKLADGMYSFVRQMPNFKWIILFQFIFLTFIILVTYITLSYISYLGHAIQNPNQQLSIVEYNYQQYILIIICFYFLQFNIYFVLGLGKLAIGILIYENYHSLNKTNLKNIIKIILKFQLGSIVLTALIQSFNQLPLYILQWLQYVLNVLQLWFDERLRISLNNMISHFKYCDDRQYIILAFTGLSIRESSSLLIMINDEYKLDRFYNPLSYNLIISSSDIAINGILTFGIIVSILIGINIKLYAQYIMFFWYIFLTAFIISNATLTYIQYILKSIIMLIIIDGDCHAEERENLPKIILGYHKFCNLQRKIFDEDNFLFKINKQYVKLKELKLKQADNNQSTEILESNIQELQTQQLIHDEYRDQLDEEYRKIVQVQVHQESN